MQKKLARDSTEIERLFALAPGSPAAKEHGCTCAPTDGQVDQPDFKCPIHGLEAVAVVIGNVEIE